MLSLSPLSQRSNTWRKWITYILLLSLSPRSQRSNIWRKWMIWTKFFKRNEKKKGKKTKQNYSCASVCASILSLSFLHYIFFMKRGGQKMVVSSFPPFKLDHKQHFHSLLCLEKRFFPYFWVFLRVNLHLYKSNSLHSTSFHANWRLSMHEIHAATNAWKGTNLKYNFIVGEVQCWGVSLEDCFYFYP